MAEPLVQAQALGKTYLRRSTLFGTSGVTVPAVQDVTWALQPGERLGLVGESGCGKTTLAKLVVGLLQPTAGRVLIQGRPLAALRGSDRMAARRAVQMVFQDPLNSLDPRCRIDAILSEPLAIHRLAAGSARGQRVRSLLNMVQLPADYAHRLPRELSGGERQRVGIARALAVEPAALICDEPIASLDASVGATILELLRTISERQQMAMLFISHDLRAVAWLCDRIGVMQDGRLLETISRNDLRGGSQHPYTQQLLRAATLDLDS